MQSASFGPGIENEGYGEVAGASWSGDIKGLSCQQHIVSMCGDNCLRREIGGLVGARSPRATDQVGR